MVYNHNEQVDPDEFLQASVLLKNGPLAEKTNLVGKKSEFKKSNGGNERVILEGVDEYENGASSKRVFDKIGDEMHKERVVSERSEQGMGNRLDRAYEGVKDTLRVGRHFVEENRGKGFYGVGKHQKDVFDLKEHLNVNRRTDDVHNYSQIQMELDKLKETHRRMFAVKGKIYLAVEKEVAKFKKESEEKNEVGIRMKDREIQRLNDELEVLKKDYEIMREERDKFRTVYFKLKEKYKNRK